jgi:glycosyltransferase involved in cell wall biosynthesis
MNVAIYHNAYPTGAKRTIYELAREFKEGKNNVDVYTTTLSDESYLPSSEVSRQVFNYPLYLHRSLSPKLRLPYFRKYVALGLDLANLAKLQDVEKEIASDIAAKGYDFAFVHSTRLVKAPFVLRYLKSANVPAIYFCQEPPRELYEARATPYMLNPSLVNKIQETWYLPAEWIWARRIRLIDQDNLRSSTYVLANSLFSAENIYWVYGIYPKVAYLGVNTDRFCRNQMHKENFVISAGAVAPLKGYDFIIRALALLEESVRPKFMISATTFSLAEMSYLQELAGKTDVKLEFVRNPTQRQLVELYNRAIVCVYAPHLEPLGLVPLESMACGTPVVAVKEGGVRETILDGLTGVLVERSEELFADALQRLLNDPDLYCKFSSAGITWVRDRWTWKNCYERIVAVAQNLAHA